MIKVLAAETHYLGTDGKVRLSAVDWYRLHNPLKEVDKHCKDIKVDFIKRIIPKDGNEDLEWAKIGKNYDILYTSYIDTPKAYAYIKAISHKYGIKHITDLDDNLFEVDKMNPVYLRYYPDSVDLKNATIMIQDSQFISVSTPHLKNVVDRVRGRKDSVLLPNYANLEAYKYDKDKVPDNSPDIIVGYQGSSTHYSDLFKTGVMDAMRRLMNEYSELKFYIIGMGTEDIYQYLPKERVILEGGERDHKNWRKKWQELPIDIGIAPLTDTSFNRAKSSIKYYEYAMRKIPAVYSFVNSYTQVVLENRTGLLAVDTLSWYYKIKRLIDSKKLRKQIGEASFKDVKKKYNIKNNYKPVEDFIRKVAND